ncbi:MAG: DUF4419 domain-containing protein [Proteobacteria bacterium]|nr:DUF4419 domain-containing protein [Pseudomonadota bacterium]
MSVTFAVSDVEPTTDALPTVPFTRAIDILTGQAGTDEFKLGERGKLTVEAHSTHPDGMVATSYHSFATAAIQAFNAHRRLVLGPDQVWTLLAQGFANHVRLHAETLRSRLVAHQNKLVLAVRRDDFVKGHPENPWHEVIAEFGQAIARHIGKRHDWVVADFTTTTGLERTVSTLTLMDSVASYFDYMVRTMCGIPAITLLGTPADWRSIRTRAQLFREFDLDWWADALTVALDALVDASEGRADVELWRSFVKVQSASGGPYLSGWINVLFPYCQDWRGQLHRNPHVEKWQRGFQATFPWGLTTEQLPGGLASVPVLWDYLGQPINMEFLGGFVGLQPLDDGAVAPALGWAIREVIEPASSPPDLT